MLKIINSSGAETRMFQKNQDETIVADALAPCVTRPSAAMNKAAMELTL